MRTLLWLLLVVTLVGCGVKGPPRPPIDGAAPAQATDAGCCQEKK